MFPFQSDRLVSLQLHLLSTSWDSNKSPRVLLLNMPVSVSAEGGWQVSLHFVFVQPI